MSGVRRAALTAVGWCLATLSASGADDKPPPPDDTPIKTIVAHFAKNGVPLEKHKDSNWWVLTDAKGDGYEMVVAIRTFPAKATEQQMREELQTINLYFMLNAPARVAMSRPSLRLTDPAKKPPPEKTAAGAKLEKLFKDYRPPDPTK